MKYLLQPFGSKLVAGDTWQWSVSLAPDFDASLYSLHYYFRGNGGTVDVLATGTGNDFTVTVAAVDTAKLAGAQKSGGIVAWSASVIETATTYRTELDRGTVEILPDIKAASADFDGRSQVKRTLDAIRAVLEGVASRFDMEYQVGGRHLRIVPRDELLRMRNQYEAEYRKELAEAGQLPPQNNQIQVAFK